MIERVCDYVTALQYRCELQNLGFKVAMIPLDDKAEKFLIKAYRRAI